MKKKAFIIARDHRRAKMYARAQGWDESSYKYVTHSDQLCGLTADRCLVILLEDWYEGKNVAFIDEVQIVTKMKGLSVYHVMDDRKPFHMEKPE